MSDSLHSPLRAAMALLEKADEAMYHSKKTGRNGVSFFGVGATLVRADSASEGRSADRRGERRMVAPTNELQREFVPLHRRREARLRPMESRQAANRKSFGSKSDRFGFRPLDGPQRRVS